MRFTIVFSYISFAALTCWTTKSEHLRRGEIYGTIQDNGLPTLTTPDENSIKIDELEGHDNKPIHVNQEHQRQLEGNGKGGKHSGTLEESLGDAVLDRDDAADGDSPPDSGKGDEENLGELDGEELDADNSDGTRKLQGTVLEAEDPDDGLPLVVEPGEERHLSVRCPGRRSVKYVITNRSRFPLYYKGAYGKGRYQYYRYIHSRRKTPNLCSYTYYSHTDLELALIYQWSDDSHYRVVFYHHNPWHGKNRHGIKLYYHSGRPSWWWYWKHVPKVTQGRKLVLRYGKAYLSSTISSGAHAVAKYVLKVRG